MSILSNLIETVYDLSHSSENSISIAEYEIQSIGETIERLLVFAQSLLGQINLFVLPVFEDISEQQKSDDEKPDYIYSESPFSEKFDQPIGITPLIFEIKNRNLTESLRLINEQIFNSFREVTEFQSISPFESVIVRNDGEFSSNLSYDQFRKNQVNIITQILAHIPTNVSHGDGSGLRDYSVQDITYFQKSSKSEEHERDQRIPLNDIPGILGRNWITTLVNEHKKVTDLRDYTLSLVDPKTVNIPSPIAKITKYDDLKIINDESRSIINRSEESTILSGTGMLQRRFMDMDPIVRINDLAPLIDINSVTTRDNLIVRILGQNLFDRTLNSLQDTRDYSLNQDDVISANKDELMNSEPFVIPLNIKGNIVSVGNLPSKRVQLPVITPFSISVPTKNESLPEIKYPVKPDQSVNSQNISTIATLPSLGLSSHFSSILPSLENLNVKGQKIHQIPIFQLYKSFDAENPMKTSHDDYPPQGSHFDIINLSPVNVLKQSQGMYNTSIGMLWQGMNDMLRPLSTSSEGGKIKPNIILPSTVQNISREDAIWSLIHQGPAGYVTQPGPVIISHGSVGGQPNNKITHFNNEFSITVNVQGKTADRDVKTLARKIGNILSDELKRYGGAT